MTDLSSQSGGITLISASAGSGKTWQITEIIKDAISQGLAAEEILATTFTRKAAAELVERARAKLLAQADAKLTAEAAHLSDSLVGTVNSVCGHLLADFAFEAGLPPSLTVLGETEQPLAYKQAVEPVVARYMEQIEPLAYRLGSSERAIRRAQTRGRMYGKEWREHVADVVALARSNRLDGDALRSCAKRSAERYLELLDPPLTDRTAEEMDNQMARAIQQVLDAVAEGDGTKKTEKAIEDLRQANRGFDTSGRLPYAEWARLANLDPAKGSLELCQPVIQLAELHDRHPGLRADLGGFIPLVFSCAIECLDAYRDYKRREGLIDFIDQETRTFELLGRDDVGSRLAERLKHLVVDEFQDTSPIQLAVFMRLAAVIGRASWVGDQKQAIYGFRGTDPELMDAVVAQLAQQEAPEILGTSRRSRPSLVRLVNHAFTPAFEDSGIPADYVRLEAHREELEGDPAALGFWRLGAKNEKGRAAAIAGGVLDLVARADQHSVCDPITGQERPLRPGDIAILCRQNETAEAIAANLAERGMRVAVAYSGLMETPEIRLGLAALRYMVDEEDTLAVAEMLHLENTNPQWFHEWVANRESPSWKLEPRIARIDAARSGLLDRTPRELLDVALASGGIAAAVARWPESAQRLANIDALRGLAQKYEEYCSAQRLAGSAQGLISFLMEDCAETRELNKQPEATGPEAVNILTYHRAKGLEWPLVVLTELSSLRERGMHAAHVVAREEGFDPYRPLDERWVRFWPYPYLGRTKNIGLADQAAATPEASAMRERSHREELRLLYVGFTRARDYLVLAVQPGKTAWLDILKDASDEPLLTVPDPGDQDFHTPEGAVRISTREFAPGDEVLESDEPEVYAAALPDGAPPTYPRARIVPSRLPAEESSAEQELEVIGIGDRLRLRGTVDMALLGSALHDFLAADDPDRDGPDREGMARQLMGRWGVENAMEGADFVAASNRLFTFLRERYGEHQIYREWPVHCRHQNGQELTGALDLLVELETDDKRGFALFDHKSFPGKEEEWVNKALSYRPQVLAYKGAVEDATGGQVRETFIHLPIVGRMVRLT